MLCSYRVISKPELMYNGNVSIRVKEHFISLMALITKVNIRTVSLTVKEFLHLNQEQSTKVCSKMEIQLT